MYYVCVTNIYIYIYCATRVLQGDAVARGEAAEVAVLPNLLEVANNDDNNITL